MRSLLFALCLTAVAAAQAAYVPERVFDSAHKEFTDFEAMLADLVKADVVLVGEQHDDPNTHHLELAVLEGIARRRTNQIIVGLEMFERDVQEPLDRFLTGEAAEPEFLKSARPWPNYAKDYKPLVEFAIRKQWRVVASNVPRPMASDVSKTGLDALKTRTGDETRWFASDLNCPIDDDYFDRFAEAMGEHPDKSKDADKSKDKGIDKTKAAAERQSLERYYQAQCLRDETMSESVARAYELASIGGKRPLVVHFNGAFHSDYTLGTAERVKRRLPGKRVVVLSMLPVDSLDGLSPDKHDRKRADYLVFTLKDKK